MHEGHHGIIQQDSAGAHDHSHGDGSDQSVSQRLARYKKWLFPGFLLLTIVLGAIPALSRAAGFEIAVIPMVAGGAYITYGTIIAILETRRITAGLLVVIALIGSAYVGEYLAAAIVAFMMISGEFLEEITLEKTRNAVRELVRLAPDTATILRHGEWVETHIDEVQPGDRVLVRPGERIPVDGKVVLGQAAVNQATLTGESMPVDKVPGDPVFVGTVAESGSIEIVTDKVGGDTALGRIIQVVYEAQEEKGSTQRIADKFAQYFTPVILGICAVVWFATNDLMRVMAVLVIACPCALVLATPTAVVAAVGNAAKRGVMIKGGAVLEMAGRIDTLLLDKTGTLTEGRPVVLDVTSFGDRSRSEVLSTAASAEEKSEHPIARAVVSQAREDGLRWEPSGDFQQLFGVGVSASANGLQIRVGNSRLLNEQIGNCAEAMAYARSQEDLGRTALLVSKDDEIIGGIAVADTLRANAREAIAQMRQAGVSTIVMLTGDNAATAAAIASQAGITEVRAQLLPEDKMKVVSDLKSQGQVVAMVGDGVNDAPALMLADVGIAMGAAGTDVAIESAGIALMGDDLTAVSEVLALSRRTLGIIQQNIWVFAVLVNLVGIGLASTGYLSPIGSAVVHNMASVFVVLNSARLLSYRGKVAVVTQAPPPQSRRMNVGSH